MSPRPRASAPSSLCALGVLCVLLAVAITPITLRSFAEGPFPGFTGGFDEPTCQQCHFGSDLNAPGGTLTLSGVPPAYTPGQSYPLTVTLAKEGLERGGFQLAARAASGETKGADAGTFVADTPGLQLVKSADGKVTYVQHSPAGTRGAVKGALSWKLRWTAPKASVPVEFDVAANASNNDESPLDDLIYTAAAKSKPAK